MQISIVLLSYPIQILLSPTYILKTLYSQKPETELDKTHLRRKRDPSSSHPRSSGVIPLLHEIRQISVQNTLKLLWFTKVSGREGTTNQPNLYLSFIIYYLAFLWKYLYCPRTFLLVSFRRNLILSVDFTNKTRKDSFTIWNWLWFPLLKRQKNLH